MKFFHLYYLHPEMGHKIYLAYSALNYTVDKNKANIFSQEELDNDPRLFWNNSGTVKYEKEATNICFARHLKAGDIVQLQTNSFSFPYIVERKKRSKYFDYENIVISRPRWNGLLNKFETMTDFLTSESVIPFILLGKYVDE